MRKLAARLVVWLCRRFAIDPFAELRLRGGGDACARGARWEQFYREAGGLADMIAAVRRGYFEAAAGLSAAETGKLYEYALADRLAREIEREVLAVVMTGKAQAERARAADREQSAQILRDF